MDFPRFWRRVVAGALLVLFFAALPAAAQDQGLDPLLFANRDETASATDVEARGFQLYRLPFFFKVCSLDTHPWGLRVTFPVSLSSLSIKRVSDVGWKFPLRWLAVGYQFGRVSGVRRYLSFPF